MNVLSITTDPELSTFRQYALESAGHAVVSLISEKDALQAAGGDASFDVVLICHHVQSGVARRLIRLFRQNHATAKVIYIVHLYGEWPEVEADRYVAGADGPAALLKVIREVTAVPAASTGQT